MSLTVVPFVIVAGMIALAYMLAPIENKNIQTVALWLIWAASGVALAAVMILFVHILATTP